ncbi:amidohydrolase [Paragemmobacter straminiformis]|uniref:Amidohydrolase n=1 Tax=Paragemmobacter straminiformis TaxID=2045119 RepID=A0A842ICV8_9RHOB|nr:amidohydrolase [Gemmobacter straminiformis]MBC2837441.1 amidohydrolase [Gemmobacter straminiformis]
MILGNARLRGETGPETGPVWLRIEGGVIGAIGQGAAPAGPGDPALDLGGALVLPGFCDSHLHLFAGGVSLSEVNLGAIHSTGELEQALRQAARDLPAGAMLCGYGANYDVMGEGRPDRHRLDAITGARPVYIVATDYHCAWANTAALKRAGVLRGGPAGADVVIGADGLATGELREFAAMGLVRRLAPSGGREALGLSGAEPEGVSQAERDRDIAALKAAMAQCAALGITTAVNMDGTLYQADLFEELARQDALPIRVSLPMTLVPGMDAARRAALLARAASADVGLLSFGRVKMFMDGVFDTWTAFRTDDYPDRPGFRGHPLFGPEEFARNCIEADAAGLSIATHAVGDGAVRATLDGYEAAARANGRRDARHRVEHVDMLHPDDLARFAGLGVIASMQPVHPPGSSGLPLEPTVSIMGRGRWGDTFPWRALQAAGAVLAFGTDWPVSPLSPWNALQSALTRRVWAAGVPDQRLGFDAVLAAYAEGGAHALFSETLRGRVAVGMQADLVALGGFDEAALVAGAVPQVGLVMVAGRVVAGGLAKGGDYDQGRLA